MSVRIVSQAEVPALLPMSECIELMAQVFATLARGEALQPLRSLLRVPDRTGILGLMPAWLGAPPAIGLKVVTVMPDNHGTEWDSESDADTFEPWADYDLGVMPRGV